MTTRTLAPRPVALALSLALLPALTTVAHAADPLDWPNWRGPNHNNTSDEANLPESWNPRGGEGSNLVWKSEALASRSTPVVMNGRLYTLARAEPGTELEGEKVICADPETGEVIWEHRFNVYLSDVPDTRVAWSSVVGDPQTGRVYAQGVCGYFCCLEGETGEVVWSRSLHEELGLLSTYGGRTNFPLVYKDTVITSAVVIGWGDTPEWGLMAKPAHRYMAFDKATGELRWLSSTTLIPDDTTYSTPALVELEGQDALVFGAGDGKVWAIKAATGEHIWNFPLSRRGLNVPPVVGPNGRVYTGHSEENIVGSMMGAVVGIDGTMSGEITLDEALWIKPQAMVGKSGPLLIDGKVYAITDTAKMNIYDAETGEDLGRKALGRVMRGTPLYADGKIYACTNEGMFYILRPTDDGVEQLHRVRLSDEEVNASPIVSHGRIYLSTSHNLYCIGKPGAEPRASEVVTEQEDARPTDTQVTHLQLSPWDTLLAPGEKQSFTARFYNESGQHLSGAQGDRSVEYEVTAGPGSISSNGEYTAPRDAKNECAMVTCSLGDLKASARVRIVPPLPWTFDFEGMDDVPLTWVGGRVRYNLREDDQNGRYIAKPIELPTRPGEPTTKLGTRSRMWMGSPDTADYTVQADVLMKSGVAGEPTGDMAEAAPQAEAGNEVLPQAGLINSRYTFTLNGPMEQAELYSWCTHDKRTQARVEMQFEPDVWYTMKITARPDPSSGRTNVYAKVWPRDEEEPADWTLEIHDEAPNYSGSPGLFGDSKWAEFYVDNLSVTPN